MSSRRFHEWIANHRDAQVFCIGVRLLCPLGGLPSESRECRATLWNVVGVSFGAAIFPDGPEYCSGSGAWWLTGYEWLLDDGHAYCLSKPDGEFYRSGEQTCAS